MNHKKQSSYKIVLEIYSNVNQLVKTLAAYPLNWLNSSLIRKKINELPKFNRTGGHGGM